jgi:hypothetical protein
MTQTPPASGTSIPAPTERTRTQEALTKALLRAGAIAGPLYLVVGAAQVLTREGFDVRRHALSLLSNGDLGWIQVASFLLSGVLVLAGALGVRRTLRARRGGTWGPLLLAGYGVGLLGAGIFRADPALGFPPGATTPATLSRGGLLHFVFGAVGFYALIAACFVFARRFAGQGERAWAAFSAITGVAFFVSFAAIASGSTAAATMLAFYGAVAWVWIWHSALSLRLAREVPHDGTLRQGASEGSSEFAAGRRGQT